MALPDQYLITTKNLDTFLNSIIGAQAPQRFTVKFLEQLEFKSTNDRLFIGMLKFLGFIDSSGIPQDKYFEFLDQTRSKKILAEAIEQSYADLFVLNKKANEMSQSDVKNKFKTLTQGQKSDKVLGLMANTFVALCNYAEFKDLKKKDVIPFNDEKYSETEEMPGSESSKFTQEIISKKITTEMHYNIQIHLPDTRDITVYDAIFKSLKTHLM